MEAPPLPSPRPGADEDRSLKIVIRNLPPLIRDQKRLEDFLKERGLASTHRRLLRKPTSYAFVAFATPEERALAVETLHGATVDGCTLVAELAEKADPERNVYVSLIPDWVGQDGILDQVSEFGSIASFTFRPPSTRFPGTLAMLVQMRTKEDASLLISSLHNITMVAEGREYKVSAEFQKPKAGGSGGSSANTSDGE